MDVSYLLKPHPSLLPPPTTQPSTTPSTQGGSSSSTNPTNISTNTTQDKGKGRGKDSDDEEEDVSVVRWERQSAQFVSKLYFFVSPNYKPLISKLDPCTLPNLFIVFDKLFKNNDQMSLITKRGELDKMVIKLDKTLLDQVVKLEEQLTQYEDLGGILSEQEKTFLLIKALPISYKEKLSNKLGEKDGNFEEIKEALTVIFKRDAAWNQGTGTTTFVPVVDC